MFRVLSDSPRIEKYFLSKFMFQNYLTVSVKSFQFYRFSTRFFSAFLNCTWKLVNIKIVDWNKSYNFYIWSFVQNSTYLQISASEYWGFLGRFWNSVLFCIWLFPFNFSPISSTQLQKLLGFESSKTLLKAPRAESCYFFICWNPNFASFIGHLAKFQALRFKQVCFKALHLKMFIIIQMHLFVFLFD